MSTLDGHNGGNQEFETFDINPNSDGNSFSLQASQEAWAPRDNRVEQVSNTMGYSGDSYPISEGLARTCTDACSRQHRQDSIPWGSPVREPVYTGQPQTFERTIPATAETSQFFISIGSDSNNGYRAPYSNGWNTYPQGDSNRVVVAGTGEVPRVQTHKSEIDIYDSGKISKEVVLIGHDAQGRPIYGSQDNNGQFSVDQGILLTDVLLKGAARLKHGFDPRSDSGDYRNSGRRGNSYYPDPRYSNRARLPQWNQSGGGTDIVVSGSGRVPNVSQRRNEIDIYDSGRIVREDVNVGNRTVRGGTPPFVPSNRGRGGLPDMSGDQVILWTDVLLKGAARMKHGW